ncbi:hypothetical protein [Methanobrevibacter sp.]|uniref:hypothetical protein n=1 Tax=Methanobrevibacter sp. TaxID=66852 RepID=UPI003865AC43
MQRYENICCFNTVDCSKSDATPHKMPEIVAMAESLLTSNKSSEYFMKNPDRTNNIASIM